MRNTHIHVCHNQIVFEYLLEPWNFKGLSRAEQTQSVYVVTHPESAYFTYYPMWF
jgi:hypothetical protein